MIDYFKKPIIQAQLDQLFTRSLFLWILPFTALDFLIKFAEQLRWVNLDEYTALQALSFSILSLPTEIQIFLPGSALLGSLWALGKLERSQMYLAMQSLGVSRTVFEKSTRSAQIRLCLSLILPLWLLAPWCEQKARYIKDPHCYAIGRHHQEKSGSWIRIEDALIHLGRGSSRQELRMITSYQFRSAPFRLEQIVRAQSATFHQGTWILKEAEAITFDSTSGKPNAVTYFESLSWSFMLSPERLEFLDAPRETLSLVALYQYSKEAIINDRERKTYRAELFNRLCLPVHTAIMIWYAQMVHRRLRPKSSFKVRIGIGLGIGIAVHACSQVARSLLNLYPVHPLVGELVPVLGLYLLFSLTLFRKPF